MTRPVAPARSDNRGFLVHRGTLGERLWGWLPTKIDRRVLLVAWLSFVAEIVIIATGGAVRLTGSGLGCPEWPLCTAGSLYPTQEMGIHGMIEFGNRLMTSVVGVLALLVFFFVLRYRKQRRDLFLLALIVLLGVAAQAIVGGITVWTELNAFIVGFHYTTSLILVCITAAFLVRAHEKPGRRERGVPIWTTLGVHVIGVLLALTIFVGVLTTASGPHSGDADVVRDGFDATLLAHIHSWPSYFLAVLVTIIMIVSIVLRLRPWPWLATLSVLIASQTFTGVWQAREGLPTLLVGIHMVLAALTAATYTVVVLRLKRTVDA